MPKRGHGEHAASLWQDILVSLPRRRTPPRPPPSHLSTLTRLTGPSRLRSIAIMAACLSLSCKCEIVVFRFLSFKPTLFRCYRHARRTTPGTLLLTGCVTRVSCAVPLAAPAARFLSACTSEPHKLRAGYNSHARMECWQVHLPFRRKLADNRIQPRGPARSQLRWGLEFDPVFSFRRRGMQAFYFFASPFTQHTQTHPNTPQHTQAHPHAQERKREKARESERGGGPRTFGFWWLCVTSWTSPTNSMSWPPTCAPCQQPPSL